jgi:hypothetical protein
MTVLTSKCPVFGWGKEESELVSTFHIFLYCLHFITMSRKKIIIHDEKELARKGGGARAPQA